MKPNDSAKVPVSPEAVSALAGREITREQALAGLGDPSTWAKEAEALKAEMKAKPTINSAARFFRWIIPLLWFAGFVLAMIALAHKLKP